MSEDRYDLPEGWVWTELGRICDKPQYGWTTSADFNGKGLKLVRTTDISSGLIEWDSVPFCKHEPDEPKKYLLSKGNILVSRAGSVGVSIEIDDCPKAIFASYLIRFKPIPPIPSKFISFYLKSPSYWASIVDNTAGIAIPNVNASKLRTLQISLPPLNEQKRIIQKIENLFDRLNKTKQQLSQIPPLLKKFRQSVLSKAFSGELTGEWRAMQKELEPASKLLERIREERKKLLGKKYKDPEPIDTSDLPELPEGWEWGSLESIGEIVTGNTPSTNKSKYYGAYLPFIKPGDLDKGKDITTAEVFLSKEGSKVARIIPPGSIMVTSIGATIGKTGIAAVECATNQQINSIVPFKEINPYYLYYYCLSPLFFNLMLTNSSSTTLPIINKGRFSILPVPIASSKEQFKIVTKIEELYTQADAIEKSVKIAQAHCEKLTQSVLAKAFRGELVEQNPNDESAEVLLKRINKSSEKLEKRVRRLNEHE